MVLVLLVAVWVHGAADSGRRCTGDEWLECMVRGVLLLSRKAFCATKRGAWTTPCVRQQPEGPGMHMGVWAGGIACGARRQGQSARQSHDEGSARALALTHTAPHTPRRSAWHWASSTVAPSSWCCSQPSPATRWCPAWRSAAGSCARGPRWGRWVGREGERMGS